MEIDTRCGQIAIVLLASFGIPGCSESDGYIDYATLPPPSVAVEVEDPTDWTPDITRETNVAATGNDAGEAESDLPRLSDPPKTEPPTAPDAKNSASQTAPEAKSAQPDVSATPASLDPTATIQVAQMPTGFHEIKLLVPEKRFRKERDTDAIRLSYDDIDLMKVLNMHPVRLNAADYFPDWLNELDGQQIRILGFMYPTFKATGLKRFTLTRDTGACCFGPDPLLYFLIEVNLEEGETTDYVESRRIDVEGTFRIDPESDDTELFRLYRIENARILSK